MDSITTILSNAKAKARNYPQFAYLLNQSGIQKYRVELPTHVITYYGNREDQVWSVGGEAIADAAQSPHSFDEAGVVAALRANQEGRTDFKTFLQQIWLSGITYYDADLQGRIVTYYGADGQFYAEHFPLAVVN